MDLLERTDARSLRGFLPNKVRDCGLKINVIKLQNIKVLLTREALLIHPKIIILLERRDKFRKKKDILPRWASVNPNLI